MEIKKDIYIKNVNISQIPGFNYYNLPVPQLSKPNTWTSINIEKSILNTWTLKKVDISAINQNDTFEKKLINYKRFEKFFSAELISLL